MLYTVRPSRTLSWSVEVSGSKNAILPLLAASLLVRGKVVFENVPRIGDVFTFLTILESIGVQYTFSGNLLTLDTSHISGEGLAKEQMKKIRASLLLMWPMLQFFGEMTVPFPGGCQLGKRPIQAHLSGFKKVGYASKEVGNMIHLKGTPKTGNLVLNAQFGVTPTENLLLINVCRPGKTTIQLAAIEPHVMDLVTFLRSAGANIKIRYNHTIIIEWVNSLVPPPPHGVIGDYIESGTFMILGALCASEYIDIHHAQKKDLYFFIQKLKEAGVKISSLGNDTLRVYRAKKLKAVDIQTNIFPGFPTDLGSPFTVLLTQADGISQIHEILFEWRLNFLVELDKMHAKTALMNPHQAVIFGKTPLKSAQVTAWDLRAGIAMVMAGMIASGETTVTNIEYIQRGYENIVGKLQALWADIIITE